MLTETKFNEIINSIKDKEDGTVILHYDEEKGIGMIFKRLDFIDEGMKVIDIEPSFRDRTSNYCWVTIELVPTFSDLKDKEFHYSLDDLHEAWDFLMFMTNEELDEIRRRKMLELGK